MNEARPDDAVPPAIEEAVLAILEGEEAHRDAALRELLLANPAHDAAIRRWLAAAGVTVPGTGNAGAMPAGPTNGGAETLPLRLGPYLLQAMLGRGGFGTVYRAEQQEPIRRPVAVKVLNPGMDSREVLSRFAAEREALNRMDHPGIARLLDAGSTPQGRPYFVMELVEGPTLASLCRQRELPLRERLELFLMVLDAMQHAHQKAVLHRDLSSNNVLVADPDGRPQPKIIDFGIAKSLSDPLLQGGAMTFQGTLMGTPEFMSPEQASGHIADLDTRADVYALGVQLYELLTDQLPIPGVVLRAQGLNQLAAAIEGHQPLRPSDAAPRQRRAALRGDLDAIVMKAIGKARDERYASVAEFAADLRRHLADEPVQVASPTRWYRLRKFVRRHRAESVAGAIVAIGLLVALGVLAMALRIATDALAEAEAQRQALAAKADAGFRLLANEERLRDAIAAAAALPPPWPEHARSFAEWQRLHGEPLTAELPKLQRKVDELQAQQQRAPGRRLADPADQHLLAALLRLQQGLAAFAGPDGETARVLRLQRFLERVRQAAADHEAAWRAAIEAVKTSDGTVASAAYRGASMPKLPGLIPLGADPTTGLFEFLDMASHAEGEPLPVRDPTSKALRTGSGTGIVFVLLPPGTVRAGTFRDEPGLPQNDPHAEDDELGGQMVRLDEFLLARTELTNGQWARLLDRGPAVDDPLLPRTGVDWQQARDVLRRFDLDLPTEAQWEYACRAGTTTPWACAEAALPEQAWFGARPQSVGSLRSNGFGLFDLHGNVAEWCRDEYLPYRNFPPRVGDGLRERAETPAGAVRAVRGGACAEGPLAARCAARDPRAPTVRDSTLGLRPVRLWRTERR